MVAMWKMLPLHIQNIHKDRKNKLHPKCGHSKLKGLQRLRLWLERGKSMFKNYY